MTLATLKRWLDEREKALRVRERELADEWIQLNRDKLVLARVMRMAERLKASHALRPLDVKLNPPQA